jgi:mRNA interferase RelE/StbE
MRYEVEIRPSALRNFKRLAPAVARRIISKIEAMRDDLRGDVKRLTNYTPEYRLRVGDYRVRHRREAHGR